MSIEKGLEARFDLFFRVPFAALWNVSIMAAIAALFVAWWGFLFGSVLGVVLMLIFFRGGFFLPLVLVHLLVPLTHEKRNIYGEVSGVDHLFQFASWSLVALVGGILVYG